MHLLNPLRPYSADIDAFTRSLKLWVLELAMWVVALVHSRAGRIELRHWLAETRREIRELICLKLAARLRFRVREGTCAATYAVAPPRGFRRVRRRVRHIRFLARGIPLQTLADMQCALADLDRVVARALARLPRRFATHQLVAVAPPVEMNFTNICNCAPDAADTS